VRCKICKKPVRRYDVGAPSGITISIPGADSQDAERRRQIALRALSERLNKSEAAQSQWPSLEDPENPESPSSSPTNTTTTTSLETKVRTSEEEEEGNPEVLVEI